MQRTVVSVLLAVGLLYLSGSVRAQPGAPDKSPTTPASPKNEKASPLESLLAKALKNNSDIRVAESKVREAEAQLNKTRMEVMQKVVKAYHEIAAHKALVAIAKQRVETLRRLQTTHTVSNEEVSTAEHALQQAKANLAKAEAEIPFLTGAQPAISFGLKYSDVPSPFRSLLDPEASTLDDKNLSQSHLTAVRNYYEAVALARPGKVKETTAEKIREVLSRPVQGEFTQEKLFKLFEEKAKGFNVVYLVFLPWRAGIIAKPPAMEPTIHFKEPVPLGAAMQWLEDSTGYSFVLRDYGIVVTSRNRMPPGAASLADLWKHTSQQAVKKAK